MVIDFCLYFLTVIYCVFCLYHVISPHNDPCLVLRQLHPSDLYVHAVMVNVFSVVCTPPAVMAYCVVYMNVVVALVELLLHVFFLCYDFAYARFYFTLSANKKKTNHLYLSLFFVGEVDLERLRRLYFSIKLNKPLGK